MLANLTDRAYRISRFLRRGDAVVTKTLVDLDEGKLAAVQNILRTATEKDTINQALNAVIVVAARRRELARLATAAYADLIFPDITPATWTGNLLLRAL